MSPYRRGTLLALAAAVSFGVTAPILKRAGAGLGPFTTAALLYLGAALASLGGAAGARRFTRRDLLRVMAVAICGAVLAPACLAWGLQRQTATAASLLLNTEALFTVGLAALVYHEHVGRRMAAALGLMLAAGGLLVVGQGRLALSWGAMAVTGAAFLWAVDNVLTRALADRDPTAVVLAKGALGALASLGLALVAGERPAMAPLVLLCGATGYGLSVRLYVMAQRVLGAGRTGSIFAVGPFVGAIVSPVVAAEPLPGAPVWVAGALFGAGIWLHLTERHFHGHRHAAVEHEHMHRHDDGHHEHGHEETVIGEHSHVHRHEEVVHEHEHGPDLHHRHGHG